MVKKIILFVLTVMFFYTQTSFAFDLEPQVRMASFHFQECGIKEGNKMLFGFGLNFSGSENRFVWSLTPEIWKLGEAVDEDSEFPQNGIALEGKIGYRFPINKDLTLTPHIGFYASQWDRVGNEKYNPTWTRLQSISTLVGFDVKYKMVYGKFDMAIPSMFDSDLQNPSNGNMSFRVPTGMSEVGITYEKFSIGIFRRVLAFNPVDSKLFITGGVISYRF